MKIQILSLPLPAVVKTYFYAKDEDALQRQKAVQADRLWKSKAVPGEYFAPDAQQDNQG